MHPFPNVPLKYINSDSSLHSLPQRYSSPSTSGLSSQFSSNYGDQEPTPWSSPAISAATYAPEAIYSDNYVYTVGGGYSSYDFEKAHAVGQCVALHDVQHYADAQPESLPVEEEHYAYGTYAQEGYQPMHEDAQPVVQCVPDETLAEDIPSHTDCSDVGPVYRRRRASAKSATSPPQGNRVTKRPLLGKRAATYQGAPRTDSTGNRAFPCPFATYGCASMFGSKNEWKRHVNTQHIRFGFWRCDQCPNGDRKPNDFNRKDLFTQHVRRMHPATAEAKKASKSKSSARSTKGDPDEEALVETARRCYRHLRSAPAKSNCLFCTQTFQGHGSWEERLEHVGRHMEAYKKDEQDIGEPADWRKDEATEEWLLKEGLVVRQKGRLVLADCKA